MGKRRSDRQSAPICTTSPENLVKISLVHHEIAGLKGTVKKNKMFATTIYGPKLSHDGTGHFISTITLRENGNLNVP